LSIRALLFPITLGGLKTGVTPLDIAHAYETFATGGKLVSGTLGAPDNGPVTTQVPDSSRVQDEITLAHTLALTRTNADYYALQLGNHVLGGAFYATRLYRDLREENGLVYFVDSTFNVGETRGVYQVQYACDPPKAAQARAVVVTDLKAMKRKT